MSLEEDIIRTFRENVDRSQRKGLPLEEDIARTFQESIGRATRAIMPPSTSLAGPVRLPRLRGVPGVFVEDKDTVLFLFEDAAGRKVQLPVDRKTLGLMEELIDYVLNVGGNARRTGPISGAVIPADEALDSKTMLDITPPPGVD